MIQDSILRAQLRALNLRDGQPWLDEERIAEAVSAISRLSGKLMETNEKATELLINGITVEGLPGWDGERGQDPTLYRLGQAGKQSFYGC